MSRGMRAGSPPIAGEHSLWKSRRAVFGRLIHGIGFGALYLLACSGAIVELWRRYSPAAEAPVTARDEAFLSQLGADAMTSNDE